MNNDHSPGQDQGNRNPWPKPMSKFINHILQTHSDTWRVDIVNERTKKKIRQIIKAPSSDDAVMLASNLIYKNQASNHPQDTYTTTAVLVSGVRKLWEVVCPQIDEPQACQSAPLWERKPQFLGRVVAFDADHALFLAAHAFRVNIKHLSVCQI